MPIPNIAHLAETQYTGKYSPQYVQKTSFGRVCLDPRFPDRNALFDCQSNTLPTTLLNEINQVFNQNNLPFHHICGHNKNTYNNLQTVLPDHGWRETKQWIMLHKTKPRRPTNPSVHIETIPAKDLPQSTSFKLFLTENDGAYAWPYHCANEPRLGGEVLIGWLNNRPVGMCGWYVVNRIARFRSIVTQEWAWGQGVATTLIHYVQQHPTVCKQNALAIFSAPKERHGAETLYEQLGFQKAGLLWGFKHKGDNT